VVFLLDQSLEVSAVVNTSTITVLS